MFDANRSALGALGQFSTTHTKREADIVPDLAALFEHSPLSTSQRLAAFPRHVRRQEVARFLTRYEIFKLALGVAGSIAECGVFMGAGLISWLHYSSILEPYNHQRRIIGFDTFTGFPAVHSSDLAKLASELHVQGAFGTHDFIRREIQALAEIHDANRPLGHIPKIELVAGDAFQTIPAYVATNKHLVLSMLYLDFDLYEPTKVALEHLYPRVAKGGVVVFDELNCPNFPGETQALFETLNVSDLRLERNPMDPYISWFIK